VLCSLQTFLPVLLLAAALVAQDEPRSEPDPARDALSRALVKLHQANDIVVRALVDHAASRDGPAPAGGGAVMVATSGNFGLPFSGAVDAWRARDGVVVVTSVDELPGFDLYIGPSRTVRRLTFEDRPPALDQVEAELASLLDPQRFTAAVRAAKLAVVHDEATGETIFRGEVDRKIVRPIAPGATPFPKRTLRADVELVLAEAGRLARSKVTVHHSDPMERLARAQIAKFAGGVAGPGGMIPIAPDDEDDAAEDHDTETGSTTYAFTYAAEPRAPDRAQEFKRHVERLAGR
jgi:hypothetical protein